jgi:serine/threonine-protein kinase PpkA
MASTKHKAELPEIPGFRVLRTLGRGGMAQVYLALQESIDREVAIKVMLSALHVDESFSERFLREARISAKLSHPNIVSVYDVGVANGMHYLAMEYLPGGDLKDRIRKGLPIRDSLRILREIAGALDFAHTKGFVHRDIKPENILFSQTGAAVLSDFGIARASDGGTHLTATGSIVGTPHYMSPEQAQGKPVDGRSDLYSLGIVFYQMLTGKVPFEGDSALSIGIKHIRDPIPELPARATPYQPFLARMLAKNPDERWQTGADVVRALEIMEMEGEEQGSATIAATVISAEAVDARTEVLQTGAGGKKSRAPLVLFALVLLAGLVGGAWYYMNGKIPGLGVSSARAPVAAAPQTASKPERIASLLAAARKDLDAKRYMRPENRNAYDKYRAVLSLDAANPDALSGMRAIGDAFIARARTRIHKSKLDAAGADLARSRQVDEKNPELAVAEAELAAARKTISERRAAARKQDAARAEQKRRANEARLRHEKIAAERQARIKGFINDVSAYLDPIRLSETRVKRAYEAYQSAYRIAPNDPSVRRLPEKIADGYQILADDQRAARHWDRARRLVQAGLAVLPDHRGLRTLSARIDDDEANAPKVRRTFGGF